MRCVGVTCYFRHLREIFEKAGIEVTEANKREIDRVIHEIVGVKIQGLSVHMEGIEEAGCTR